MRCDKVKGCFCGVKFNDENKCISAVEHPKYTEEYVNSLLLKIKELEEQVKTLESITCEDNDILEKGRLYITLQDDKVMEEDKVIYEDAIDLMETSF